MNEEVRFITRNFGRYDVSSLASYKKIGGFGALEKALAIGREATLDIISAAKVRGRGGAEFDMGEKWARVRAAAGDKKVLICNANEGEPYTLKDRELLRQDPFNLIEGMAIASYVLGASDGYIYLCDEYSHLRPLLLDALRQARAAGYLGQSILGVAGFDFDIRLCAGAGSYVCGESTALINSIEGRAGRPRLKPPQIWESGLFSRPTCLNNVESLALVPHLLLDEKNVYATYGKGASIGTKLVSVTGNVKKPGVFEIPFGMTVRNIIYGLAEGMQAGRPIRFIQFGGASGKIARPNILDTPYTYEDLAAAGLSVGSGAITVVDIRTSVIDFLRLNQEFFSEESCGQCTPCREGNLHINMILKKLADGTASREDVDTMGRIAHVMTVSSLCGLGEKAQYAFMSAMKLFPETFNVGGVDK